MISPAIDRLLFCGHNRRGTERSKLRIFEIDLLIIMDFTNLVIRKILKSAMKPGCKAGKLYLWQNLLQWFDFGVGEKIANARTCADSNGHNFWKIENVEGFLHIFAYKGLKLTAV